MKKVISILFSLAFMFGLTGVAYAAVNAVTPSTNDANRTNGWAHVDQVSQGVGTTDLQFISTRAFYSCFEYRTDGDISQILSENAGVNYNTNVTDGLYPYVCENNRDETLTIPANQYVEVRMVFGAETDERFDWTRFDVIPAKVNICHKENKKSTNYHLISVSNDALAAHIKHGDGIPDTNAPGTVDKKFDNDCSIVNREWKLVDTVTVDVKSITGSPSSISLASGKQYRFDVSGTWNGGLNDADAEYISKDSWATHLDGYDIAPYIMGPGDFDLQVNNEFVNWGTYSSAHEYSLPFSGIGNPVNFRVFDGDSYTNTINPGWYGDNTGSSLTVKIYELQ